LAVYKEQVSKLNPKQIINKIYLPKSNKPVINKNQIFESVQIQNKFKRSQPSDIMQN